MKTTTDKLGQALTRRGRRIGTTFGAVDATGRPTGAAFPPSHFGAPPALKLITANACRR